MRKLLFILLLIFGSSLVYGQKGFQANFEYSWLVGSHASFIPSSVVSPTAFFTWESASSLAMKNSNKFLVGAFFPISHSCGSAFYSDKKACISNPYSARTPGDALLNGGINYMVNKIASKNWGLKRP